MRTLRARRLPHAWQEIAHIFFILFGWAVFIWLWWDVMQGQWDTAGFWWIVIGSILVVPAITVIWIFHNVSLYRRLGPRKSVRAVKEAYPVDFKGRQVDADWDALRNARFITIGADDTHKQFRAVTELPPSTLRKPA